MAARALLMVLLAWAPSARAAAPCNGDNSDAERILKCIKQFSASEWKSCTHDEKYECYCSNDDGVNYCCGSDDQAEAIDIWSQCLGVEDKGCDRSKCSSAWDDCCAPDGEAATCRDGYSTVYTGGGCAWFNNGDYTCCPPDGSSSPSDGLFVAGPSTGNYYEAVAYCSSINAEVAVIRSSQENEAAQQACGTSSCWIGLVEEGGSVGTSPGSQVWKWPDGTGPAYVNWQTGEPNNYDGTDERNAMINCFIEGLCGDGGGKWYDAPDTWDGAKPLCRTDDSSSSGDGGIFTITSSNGVWDDCPSECAAIGGTFTCIDDEAQNIQALAAFRGHCPGGADDCGAWIAVSDEASEGNWVCTVDGSPQTYQPWSAIGNEPNGGPGENCVNMWGPNSGRNDGAWNDYGCTDARMPCICKGGDAGAGATSTTTTGTNCRSDICTDYAGDCCAPGSEPRGCSMAGYEVESDPYGASGWGPCVSTYGQQSVYQCCSEDGGSSSPSAEDLFVAGPNGGNYYDAAAYCSSIGAEIATIYSSAENEAARLACGGSSCWIGLSEQGGSVVTSPGNQVWTWPDGNSASYFNWQQGGPNNWGGRDEKNAIMNCCGTWGQESSGKWYDAPYDYDEPRPLCRTAAAGSSSSSKKGSDDEPDSASAGFIVAILLLLLVVVLVGGIYVLYKKVLNLEAQRRPPTNPGAFFEVGAVELETTSHMAALPPKPGYVPQYPQTAAVEVPAAPYSPPRAQVLTVEPSAPERGTMV